MDAIDQALAQVRAEIEHIQKYLAKLQEAERELVMVRETRQAIAQGWQASHAAVPDKNTAPDLPTGQFVAAQPTPEAQSPLASEILRLLQATAHAMTPREIDTALRSAGRQMHGNAVTSTLSRLARNGSLVRQEGAKYSLPSRASRVSASPGSLTEPMARRSRPLSLAAQAHTVLQEVGKPLTADQIVAALRAKGQDVNPRSVITALYHLAQDGQIFRRMGSKKFGLLEWAEQPNGHDEAMELSDTTVTYDEDLDEESTMAGHTGGGMPSTEETIPVIYDNNNFVASGRSE